MNVGIELSSIMLKSVRAYVILTLRNKIECGQPPRFLACAVLLVGLVGVPCGGFVMEFLCGAC